MTQGPRGSVAAAGAVVATLLAAVGLATSRADVVALALPIALTVALGAGRARRSHPPTVSTGAPERDDDGVVRTRLEIAGEGGPVHATVVLGSVRARDIVVADGDEVTAESPARHSGTWTPVSASARAIDLDAGEAGDSTAPRIVEQALPPAERRIRALPVPARLSGAHGAHPGRRPGQGGDFRDIHPFAPGDELRRVDWKATARLARRTGELFVRRVDALSDATIAIVVDATVDIGEVVATWPSGDPDGGGTTSLDLAREAARSIGAAGIANGDRVALHELGVGGRILRAGGGARHRARLVNAAATLGVRDPAWLSARTPPVGPGAVVYVVSTLLDGPSSELALSWAAAGHLVVVVDVLPSLDDVRLSASERDALCLVRAEREETVRALRRARVEVVRWADDGPRALETLARRPS